MTALERTQAVQSICAERPENLFWLPTETLSGFAAEIDNDLGDREKVIAELVARWCLSGNDALAGFLRDLLPDWQKFADWYTVDETFAIDRELPTASGQWRDPEGLPGCEACVRQRLRRLFRVDGFIPVCICGRENSGMFIPFELVKSSEANRIVWSDGSPCAEWSVEADEALLPGFHCRLQVSRYDVGVEGASLMLPLRMACWRKERGSDFPRYDVFRVVATGKIENGRLASVRTKEKLDALEAVFWKGTKLIGPAGEIDPSKRSYLCLDVGVDMESAKAEIRDALERAELVDRAGVARITWRYALGRLSDMQENVDRLNRERWTDVADRLGAMKDKVGGYNDDAYLNFLALYAVALCHAGRTQESIAANRDAYDFACQLKKELKKEGLAIRLQIEQMVNAQDVGDLEGFRILRSNVESRLADYNGSDADDLRMRYHGTVAQAEMWGALLRLDGYSVASAREHAQEAVAVAKRISGRIPEDASDADKDKAESNVQQDLNYLHLWHAIFAAGTDGERAACSAAENHLCELSEKSKENNARFLLRQKSLALLNAWQKDGKMPAVAYLDKVKVPLQGSEGWLVAANRAHLGTLYAAAGEQEMAQVAFAEGESALPLAHRSSPVLGSIRFVLLVRAVCALREFGDESEVTRFKGLATETYERFRASRLFALFGADAWMQSMGDGASSRKLPLFYY